MGCRILEGWERGEPAGAPTKALFFCSTSGWAFGPVFETTKGWTATEIADQFREFLAPKDPRAYDDDVLEKLYAEFLEDELKERP